MSTLEAPLVGRALRLCWPNLPALTVGSVLAAGAWAFVRALAPLGWWVVWVGLGLLVVPALAVLVAAGTRMLEGDGVGVVGLLRSVPQCVWRSRGVSGPVLAAGLLVGAADEMWRRTGQAWVLLSAGMALAVLLGLFLVGTMTLPYALSTRTRLGEAWRVGVYLAWRNPVIVLGIAAACTLATAASAHLSFATLLFLPAPLALVWAAGATTARQRGRATLDSPPRPR